MLGVQKKKKNITSGYIMIITVYTALLLKRIMIKCFYINKKVNLDFIFAVQLIESWWGVNCEVVCLYMISSLNFVSYIQQLRTYICSLHYSICNQLANRLLKSRHYINHICVYFFSNIKKSVSYFFWIVFIVSFLKL